MVAASFLTTLLFALAIVAKQGVKRNSLKRLPFIKSRSHSNDHRRLKARAEALGISLSHRDDNANFHSESTLAGIPVTTYMADVRVGDPGTPCK